MSLMLFDDHLAAVIMYVLLPMPLLFFAGSDTSSLFSESGNRLAIFYLKFNLRLMLYLSLNLKT